MSIRNKRILFVGIIVVLLNLLVFITSPDNLPLPLLTAPFILIFAGLYLSLQLILERFARDLRPRTRRGLSLTIAALPVLLLLLQSIGQLTPRDLIITLGLIALLLFYFRKTDFL